MEPGDLKLGLTSSQYKTCEKLGTGWRKKRPVPNVWNVSFFVKVEPVCKMECPKSVWTLFSVTKFNFFWQDEVLQMCEMWKHFFSLTKFIFFCKMKFQMCEMWENSYFFKFYFSLQDDVFQMCATWLESGNQFCSERDSGFICIQPQTFDWNPANMLLRENTSELLSKLTKMGWFLHKK